METTTLMSSVIEIPNRFSHAPARLLNASGPNVETRQSVAADGQNIPPSANQEAGAAVAREGMASREGTPPQEGMASREELNAVVSRLGDHVQSIQRALDFSVDEETGRTVITVTDAKTDQVIRQIPPEEALHMLDQIEVGGKDGWQGAKGLFVQENA